MASDIEKPPVLQCTEIDIPRLVEMLPKDGIAKDEDAPRLPPDLISTVMQIKSSWPVVRAALHSKKEIAVKTMNSHTKTGSSRL